MSRDRTTPPISVCICAFNGAAVVGRSIESVLEQTYGDFELLVFDDASADGTVEVAKEYADERIVVVRNHSNLGNAGNRSKALRRARGELVKFVDQDDWIEPACLAEHLALFGKSETLGFTFSRRHVALEDESSQAGRDWKSAYSDPHAVFGEVRDVNSGRQMLQRYIEAGLPGNWIGEPSSVMIRRACLVRSGLFNRRLAQMLDWDLWIRLMAFFDVGYLDAQLATRWVAASSDTARVRATRRDWLDRLWMLEGLRELPELWNSYPQLQAMRRSEQKSLVMSLLTGRYRRAGIVDAIADAADYARYVALRSNGSAPALLERLDCG